MKYYDLQRNWPKVRPHLRNRELNDILVRDFNKFTWGRWRQKFRPGQFPQEFESCFWWLDDPRPGRKPAFWRYTKHSACHWLVNFNLRLAMLVRPKRKWHIITSDEHSTVWDGEDTLFEFNYLAMGIPAMECFNRAFDGQLAPGELLMVYYARHYKKEP